ncbi:MAG: phosphomannomutase/phosphoglucomutase [Halobacteria archaeon]
MTSFFHAYDLRGKYPDEIGVEEAERVGKSYGTYVSRELDGERILVGRDGRNHGPEVTDAFVEGVVSTGVDVDNAGLAATPVVYYGTKYRDYVSSTVVTASHNPGEYTGFKFTLEGALSMSRDGGMREIEEIYVEEDFSEAEKPGEVDDVDLDADYVEFVAEKIEPGWEFDVAVNYGNGVTATVAGDVLREIGCNVLEVNQDLDGDFPNHLPDPGEEDAQSQLLEAIEKSGDDIDPEIGVLFDGDGDRAGFIVGGEYVDEDSVIALFSEDALDREKGSVVHDLRCSKLVPETIEAKGGEGRESRVGHTFISEEIHADPETVFAGEVSGHYYFPSYQVPWDDGVFAAALFCRIASEEDIEEMLDSFPEYPVGPELRIDCPEEAKECVVEEVAEIYRSHPVSTEDGVKIYFNEGWALVRPSNTQPKMSLRCEADTVGALERIQNNVEETVRGAIENCSSQ